LRKLFRYWSELLVFGVIFTILMIDLAPDYTFMNKAADSIGYIYSAKYLYPSYHSSPPLYLLVSHLFLMISFGTEAWRMGLVSVLSTMGACVFIYLTIRKLIPNRFYPILGVLFYGTSALVLSQSIVVNTYATTCMLASGAYYFAISKKWKLVGLMIGIGLAVHLLMGFVFLITLIAFKEYRTNWKSLLITLSFGVFYLYVPLANRPPYMWFPDTTQTNTLLFLIKDVFNVINELIGKLSIYAFPKRVIETAGFLLVSVGVIGVIPIIYYFKKVGIKKNPLFYYILVPIVLFITELDPNTFDYTMLAMPFLSIVVCLGLDGLKSKQLVVSLTIILVACGIFNTYYFDIGNTLDPNLSAAKLYKDFDKIPDDAIFMPNANWEWEAIYKYNADYNKHIYPICLEFLSFESYRAQLKKDGVKLTENNDSNMSVLSKRVAQSIVLLNDNVWTTVSTNPRTFGVDVVKADNPAMVANVDEVKLAALSLNPRWEWMPSNPYDIMTTSIYVEEWNYVTVSNYSCLFFGIIILTGWVLSTQVWKTKERYFGKNIE